MLKASIHGKVSSKLERSEDILTSNIFGSLNYVTDTSIICSILENSMTLNHQNLFIKGDNPVVEFWFWPRLVKSEPDVLLSIKTDTNEYIILIEAKYRSGKSGEGDEEELKKEESPFFDQLAREYSDLKADSSLSDLGVPLQANRYLIYLTMDHLLPKEDMTKSIKTIQEKLQSDGEDLYWLSWGAFFKEISKWTPQHPIDTKIKKDLESYLVRKGIKRFSGFTLLEQETLAWDYQSSIPNKKEVATDSLPHSYFTNIEPITLMGDFYKRRNVT